MSTNLIKIHKRSYTVQNAIFFENSITLYNIISSNFSVIIRDNNKSWRYIKNEFIEKRKWPTNEKKRTYINFGREMRKKFTVRSN